MVATLGGFLGRKSDGESGTEALWYGLQRLDDITEMYKVVRAILGQPLLRPINLVVKENMGKGQFRKGGRG